jgi:myo-inositol catabolism protein IolC
MNPGYLKPLYLLPFDHRDSYVRDMFHFQFPLTAEQHQNVVASKQIIYDGFLASIGTNGLKPRAGILVDEQFGTNILRDAKRRDLITALSIERSGGKEFEFEYGPDFANHIELFRPTFAKVLVRYNPEGDADLNQRQLDKLYLLSDYCQKSDQLFMFELLVPATNSQMSWYHADVNAYDRKCRPELMVQAICEIQDAGIEVDVWKIEGLDDRNDCIKVIEAARRNGRSDVSCIVLGRGANEKKMAEWLNTAASVPGYVGFAVGRTTFWDAVAELEAKRIVRQVAISRIAQRYRMWVNIFEQAQSGKINSGSDASLPDKYIAKGSA